MKNAKKSMFITTILMVAVLIVAVSTATFAWYTAAAGGSVGTSTITSAKSQEANITIGWTAGDTTTGIEDLAPDKTVAPAVPVAAFTNANVFAAAEDVNVMKFNKASIETDGTFATAGQEADGDLWKIQKDTYTSFFVTNRHTTTDATVTMSINVADTEELRDQLFVAVFIDNVFAGVLNDNNKQYTYGVISAGDSATPGASAPMKTAASTTSISFDLTAAGGNAEIKLVAWLDGTTTVDANSDKTVAFAFNFGATLKA